MKDSFLLFRVPLMSRHMGWMGWFRRYNSFFTRMSTRHDTSGEAAGYSVVDSLVRLEALSRIPLPMLGT